MDHSCIYTREIDTQEDGEKQHTQMSDIDTARLFVFGSILPPKRIDDVCIALDTEELSIHHTVHAHLWIDGTQHLHGSVMLMSSCISLEENFFYEFDEEEEDDPMEEDIE